MIEAFLNKQEKRNSTSQHFTSVLTYGHIQLQTKKTLGRTLHPRASPENSTTIILQHAMYLCTHYPAHSHDTR